MLGWILENIGTIVVCAVVVAVMALIIVRMVKNKKAGKSSCGCNCGNCPMSGQCHK